MSGAYIYIILIALIAISAFFSATETAFSTVNKIRIKKQAEDGDKKAKLVCFVIDNFDRSLTTILIGNNIVNIGASSLATVAAINLFGESGAAIATIAMTILILIFGEILPKSLANEHSETWSLISVKVLRAFMFVVYPITFLFIKLKEFIIKMTERNKPQDYHEPSVTEQELKYLVENIEEEGVLEKQESELVQSALMFDEKTVQEILTPRVDMVAIDIEDPLEENIKIILESRYSRIPVYRSSIDKIIGTLHTREFLKELATDSISDIENMLSPAFFVYKTKRLSSLLADFKHNRMHIAIVTDDYGGTLGIVTMEDLLEQLVGDIWDEDELANPDLVKINDDNYLISGDMPIRDMFELLDFSPTDFECEHKTMGGWAFQSFSRIPDIGDTFVFESLEITVLEMEDQRITKMRVTHKKEG